MDRMGPGRMWGGGMGMIGPWLGLLFLLGVLALVVVGVVWLARRRTKATAGVSATGEGHSALAVLQNRLAAGEISIEEYQRIRDELRN